MKQKTFWITSGPHGPEGDIIYAQESALRIRVRRMNAHNWLPTPREVQLYCLIGDEMLAFETMAIKPDDALDMAAAIRHYAVYYGITETILFTKEPRPASYYSNDQSGAL